MSVSGVTAVITTGHLDRLIVEEVGDFGLGVAVDEPEQVRVVVLHAVLRVMLLSEEKRCLRVSVMGRLLDVKVLREVGGSFGAEVDARAQERNKLGRVWLQFLSEI